MDTVISLKGVSKAYRIGNEDNINLKSILTGKVNHHTKYALKDISFDITRGEHIGIIGRNGAGKSTLLKILCGIIMPTEGEVKIEGRIGSIIELGAGFNPEYSGIENIRLFGIINDISEEEINKSMDSIVAFADIGEYINLPIKTYSSGMNARLAFAAAISFKPDVLIVDEALSVGDMEFQHKCMAKMKEITATGTTLIFVSHDSNAVKSICSRCIYLEDGKIKSIGESEQVINMYLKDIRKFEMQSPKMYDAIENKTDSLECNNSFDLFIKNEKYDIVDKTRYGTGKSRIKNVVLMNENNQLSKQFNFGETILVRIYIECYSKIENLNCCILIRDKNGIDITGTTTFEENIDIPVVDRGEMYIVDFSFVNRLKHNMSYSVSVTLNDTMSYEEQEILDHLDITESFFCSYLPQRPVWYSYLENFNIDINKVI